MKQIFNTTLIFLIASFSCGNSSENGDKHSAKVEEKPNILFILTDYLGYNDLNNICNLKYSLLELCER